jgi:hypothetical protein
MVEGQSRRQPRERREREVNNSKRQHAVLSKHEGTQAARPKWGDIDLHLTFGRRVSTAGSDPFSLVTTKVLSLVTRIVYGFNEIHLEHNKKCVQYFHNVSHTLSRVHDRVYVGVVFSPATPLPSHHILTKAAPGLDRSLAMINPDNVFVRSPSASSLQRSLNSLFCRFQPSR